MEVRVGGVDGKVQTVAMDNGRGRLALPAGETYTLDPASRLLRALPHIVEYQQDAAARRKAAEEAAKAKSR